MTKKIKLEIHCVFGLRQEVRNNLHFLDDQTIIYPSGNNCVYYNTHQQWTKLIPGASAHHEGTQGIQALAMSPNRHYLAVSECSEQATITIYEVQGEKYSKSQVLTGCSIDVREFICMAFSADTKYLVAQSRGHKWILFYWEWEKNEVIATVNTTKLGFVSQVSFNPTDNTQICVSGNNLFKLFKLENNSLNQTSSFMMDKENITSHAWIAEDCIVLGTDQGKVVMFEAGQYHTLRRPFVRGTVKNTSSITARLCSTLIMQYSKGFICAVSPGLVCLYEKLWESVYRTTTEIRIPEDPCSYQPHQSALQEITAMCLSPSEEILAISTRQGQIYHTNLTSTENTQEMEQEKINQAKFEYLFHSVHSGSITSLATCASKPLFATCSKDNSVRIWNYNTNSIELHQEFPEEPKCISLHPNGLCFLVGFSVKVCLMNLVDGGSRTVQNFDIHNCSECVFNHDGNLFAAVRDNLVYICKIRTGTKVGLKGHPNKVHSVKWSNDDCHLVSYGMDGKAYFWNTVTDDHESEKLQNTCIYMDFSVFSPNTTSVLAVGIDSTLNKVQFQQVLQVLKEIVTDDTTYTAITMTQSDHALFVGTAAGSIRVMEYPLKRNYWTEYQAHSGPITKMVITPDDQHLVTASEDGSLFIWKITDQKRCRLVKETSYTEEFLCTKAFLAKKDQSILDAHAEVELLKRELNHMQENFSQENEALKHQIQMLNTEKEEQKEMMKTMQKNYEENLHKHEDKFIQEIEALKHQIQMLNTEKEEQKQIMQNYDENLHKQEDSHSHERQNFIQEIEALKLQIQMLNTEKEEQKQMMRQNYEENMRKLEDSHMCKMLEIKQTYEDKMHKQKDFIKEKKNKHKEVNLQYEQKLQVAMETIMNLEFKLKVMEKQMMQFSKINGEMQDQSIMISQFKAKAEDTNSTTKEVIEDLKEKLENMKQEMYTERKKIRTLLLKMKAGIIKCSNVIHQPNQLKDNFIIFRKFFISETDAILEVKPEVVEEYLMDKEHLKFSKIKADIEKQNFEISVLKKKVQSLHDQHKEMRRHKNLTKEMEDTNESIHDQVIQFQDIVELHEKSKQQNEKDLITIKAQLDELIEEGFGRISQTAEYSIEQQSSIQEDNLIKQQDKLQICEQWQKEVMEKSKSELREICIHLKQKLQAETETSMKQESEIKIMEQQMTQFWAIKGEIQDQSLEISQLEAKVKVISRKNKERTECLKQNLELLDHELYTENMKIRNVKKFIKRMKSEIKACSNVIHQPVQLKDCFISLRKAFIQEAAVIFEVNHIVMQEQTRETENPQSSVASDKQSKSVEAEIQQADCSSILKDDVQVTEISNEDEESELCLKYKHELQAEKEACSKLNHDLRQMEKQFWKIKGEIQKQRSEMNILREEVQSLQDQRMKKLKSLAKEGTESTRTIHDQEIQLQELLKMHETSKKQNEKHLLSIKKHLDELDEVNKEHNRETGQRADPEPEQLQNRTGEKDEIKEITMPILEASKYYPFRTDVKITKKTVPYFNTVSSSNSPSSARSAVKLPNIENTKTRR